MNRFSAFRSIIVPVLAALILSLMVVSTALADDAPPPVDTPAEVVQPVTDQSEGALPMAAEESAMDPDPVWCPAGVAPNPGVNGCSPSYPNLAAVVTGGHPLTNGTIWLENGSDSGPEVVIDGNGNWSASKNFSLTLQGGWNGIAGNAGINGVTVFDTGISIENWNGNVTISDIAMIAAANTAHSGTGALYIQTTKNILLKNFTAINTNYGLTDGTYLDNSASTTQATVTIKNSFFNNNISYGGLIIYSKGAVTLTNVTANNNGLYGVDIYNASDLTASPITINNSMANGNTNGRGFSIWSNGAVKLNQVSANNNASDGIYVNNSDYASSAQPVAITGFLNASGNGAGGLYILSKGAITLTNVTANNNIGDGVYANNKAALTAQLVKGIGFLTALGNGNNGLYIYSNGLVSLANLTTNNNGSYGTYIDNIPGFPTTPQAVTISGFNSFNYNYYNGMQIGSSGAITMSNLTAIGNGMATDTTGVYVWNNNNPTSPQNITLTGFNYFLNNGYNGFSAYSYGAITVYNITAAGNGKGFIDAWGSGAYLTNSGSIAAKPISVLGTNSFTNNDGDGLSAYSKGVITVANITASNNSSDGATLINANGTNAGVIVNGTNVFNYNSLDGLTIQSLGAITVNNVTATFNGASGAYLYNYFTTLQSPVTINGYGLFEWNLGNGLYIKSNGAITTRNLTANYNWGSGANLYTIGITGPQAVTLNGNNTFNYNGDAGTESGLVINSDGNIRLNNVEASYNYNRGVWLDNFANWNVRPDPNFPAFGSVTLTGFGKFINNVNNEGIYIYTHGAVVLNSVTSNFNGWDGIGIHADGNVTLVCTSTTNNRNLGSGLWMYETAPVLTLKGFYSFGNSWSSDQLLYVTLIRTTCP